ncbi:hypothetical protein IFM89_013878 [Coptis chinensis]|uniref:Uncharacterized protein n=1 Tax=Coptis chinensis TaxID=261450 RepID=A0A835LJ75_9MAGN|nr:hypothetical protein IFM89_013878 [Coptis chinensis]
MENSASCPSTPRWNIERPFLTGHFHQELLMIDDLLSALVGIEGRYTSIKRVSGIERPSSYGSLQHLPNNSVVLPIYNTPVVACKPPKMLLSNAREKEKILPWIGKFADQRRVGMLLLVVVPVVVLMSLLSAMKMLQKAMSHIIILVLHVQNNTVNVDPIEYPVHPLNSGDKDSKSASDSSLSNNMPILVSNENRTGSLPRKLETIFLSKASM